MNRLFDTAFVREPGKKYYACVSTNPARGSIDVKLAKSQHEALVSVLKESGIEVISLEPLDDLPDSVFMQDPAILGSTKAIIGRFGEKSRRGETKVFVNEIRERYLYKTGKLVFVKDSGTLEGGDVMVTETGFVVGQSGRSDLSGVNQLKRILKGKKVVPVRTNLNHLLSACTYLSDQTILIAPRLLDPSVFPGFKFIMVPDKEAHAANALYIGEQRVVLPSGFPRTAARLRESGYKPVEVDLSEFEKGDGATTCLLSPVYSAVF